MLDLCRVIWSGPEETSIVVFCVREREDEEGIFVDAISSWEARGFVEGWLCRQEERTVLVAHEKERPLIKATSHGWS